MELSRMPMNPHTHSRNQAMGALDNLRGQDEEPAIPKPMNPHRRHHSMGAVDDLRRQDVEPDFRRTNNNAAANAETTGFCSPISRMFMPPGTLEPGQNIRINDPIDRFWGDLPTAKFPWLFVYLLLLLVTVVLLIISYKYSEAHFLQQMTIQAWRWLAVVVAALIGPIFSKCAINFLLFVIKNNKFSGTRSIHLLKTIKKPIEGIIWLLEVAIVSGIFLLAEVADRVSSENRETVYSYFWKMVTWFFISMLLWLCKDLFIDSLIISLYRHHFFRKIKSTLFAEYILHSMLGPASIRRLSCRNGTLRFSASVPRNNKIKRVAVEATVEQWLNLSAWNVSAQRLVRLANIVRYSEFAHLDAHTEGLVWGADLPPGQTRCHKKALVLVEEIFRQLFPNAENPIDSCINIVELDGRIEPELLAEAKKFILLGSKKDQISGGDIKAWVIRVVRERRAVELSLSDVHVCIEHLIPGASYLIGVMVVLACIFTIVRDSTIVIAVVIFIVTQTSTIGANFNESSNHVLKALTFYFVNRKFDVGDIIRKNRTLLKVENMHLLSTVFHTADNEEISVHNSTLLLNEKVYKKLEKGAECSLAF